MKKALLFIIGLCGIIFTPLCFSTMMSVAIPVTTQVSFNGNNGNFSFTPEKTLIPGGFVWYAVYPHTCKLSVSYPTGMTGTSMVSAAGINQALDTASPYTWISPEKETQYRLTGTVKPIVMGYYLTSLTNTTGTEQTGKVTYTMECSDGRGSDYKAESYVNFTVPGKAITGEINPDGIYFTGKMNTTLQKIFVLRTSEASTTFTLVPDGVEVDGNNKMCNGSVCDIYLINGVSAKSYKLGAGTHTISFIPSQPGAYTGKFMLVMNIS